jgi:hypothetical protein
LPSPVRSLDCPVDGQGQRQRGNDADGDHVRLPIGEGPRPDLATISATESAAVTGVTIRTRRRCCGDLRGATVRGALGDAFNNRHAQVPRARFRQTSFKKQARDPPSLAFARVAPLRRATKRCGCRIGATRIGSCYSNTCISERCCQAMR